MPVYLRTCSGIPRGRAKSILTIHNLRFQGFTTSPPSNIGPACPGGFGMGALQQNWVDANMLKGGLAYADRITTVSGTYAEKFRPASTARPEDHLRYHSGKLRGIVNGIDYGMWNPETDPTLAENYGLGNVLDHKMANKLALQKELGLEENTDKFVIGLVSRLTDQKGLDLVNAIVPRFWTATPKWWFWAPATSNMRTPSGSMRTPTRALSAPASQYDEARHRIYAGADALLVPSRFEPCGLTQLNAMHYGTSADRAGDRGLKDTVEPYNTFSGEGNGFTFDRYESGLLLEPSTGPRPSTLITATTGMRWSSGIWIRTCPGLSSRQYKDLYLSSPSGKRPTA